MNRRTLLQGILAAGVAPVFIRSGLMSLWVPDTRLRMRVVLHGDSILTADGVHYTSMGSDIIERQVAADCEFVINEMSNLPLMILGLGEKEFTTADGRRFVETRNVRPR